MKEIEICLTGDFHDIFLNCFISFDNVGNI